VNRGEFGECYEDTYLDAASLMQGTFGETVTAEQLRGFDYREKEKRSNEINFEIEPKKCIQHYFYRRHWRYETTLYIIPSLLYIRSNVDK
jgi:hypothetical protein